MILICFHMAWLSQSTVHYEFIEKIEDALDKIS